MQIDSLDGPILEYLEKPPEGLNCAYICQIDVGH